MLKFKQVSSWIEKHQLTDLGDQALSQFSPLISQCQKAEAANPASPTSGTTEHMNKMMSDVFSVRIVLNVP